MYTLFSNPAFQEGEESIPLEGFIEQMCVLNMCTVLCLQSMCVCIPQWAVFCITE